MPYKANIPLCKASLITPNTSYQIIAQNSFIKEIGKKKYLNPESRKHEHKKNINNRIINIMIDEKSNNIDKFCQVKNILISSSPKNIADSLLSNSVDGNVPKKTFFEQILTMCRKKNIKYYDNIFRKTIYNISKIDPKKGRELSGKLLESLRYKTSISSQQNHKNNKYNHVLDLSSEYSKISNYEIMKILISDIRRKIFEIDKNMQDYLENCSAL